MTNLRYSLYQAYLDGEGRHAQDVMAALGIRYVVATPQTIGEQWWFWGCSGGPDPLPSYLTALSLSPRDRFSCLTPEEIALIEAAEVSP